MTYFGIPVPPWREPKLGGGATTIRFVIQGAIPSKKNNQQAIARRKEAYAFIDELAKTQGHLTPAQAKQAIRLVSAKMRGNDAYREFVEQQRPILQQQAAVWVERLQAKGLIFPLTQASCSLRFYFSKRYVQDSVNKQQSVQDLLKDCLIISDDDYTCLNPITTAADCYWEEIRDNLCVVSLTFQLKV